MRKTLLGVLALSTMVTLLATPAFAPPPTYPPDLELSSNAWHILNPNTTATLHNDGSAKLYFDFPVEPNRDCTIVDGIDECDFVNYLWTDHIPGSISGMLSIRMRVDVFTGYQGNPQITFQHTQADEFACYYNPPSVRALIWGSTSLNAKRFYSIDNYFALRPMEWNPTDGWTVTLNIPIDPSLFVNVDGIRATQVLNDWNQTVSHTKRLGVTFGGGCTLPHGVFVMDGTARFTIENYEVMPLPPNCPAVSPCPGLTTDCIRGAETGVTSAGTSRCLQGDGSLVDCGSQSVSVVTSRCQRAACCLTTPPTCTCLPSCQSGGTYLECR